MEPEFWDEKFEGEDYFFGTRPHLYFKEALQDLEPGKMLVAGDGEGRHAVYAAKLGWKVIVMDYSTKGKQKTMKLADNNGVEIEYEVVDLFEKGLPEEEYDAVGMVYAHFLPHMQESIHQKLWRAIKPGGHLVLIGFGKRQLEFNSGGPPDEKMLYDLDELKQQFPDAKVLGEFRGILDIDEGPLLQGEADQVWLLLRKEK